MNSYAMTAPAKRRYARRLSELHLLKSISNPILDADRRCRTGHISVILDVGLMLLAY